MAAPTNYTPIDELVENSSKPRKATTDYLDSPMSPSTKEAGPLSRTIEAPIMPDLKEQSNNQETLHIQEVTEPKVDLPPDLKKAGLKPVEPVQFPDMTQLVKTPISDDKILFGKTQPITSSIRWLAEFCLFLLKKAHIKLKTIHGKTVRVIKRDN